MGRPKYREPELSLKNRVLKELESKIKRKIKFIDYDRNLKFPDFYKSDNKIFLLENIRFFDGELNNSEELSRSLSSMCNVFINDAFEQVTENILQYTEYLLMDSYRKPHVKGIERTYSD